MNQIQNEILAALGQQAGLTLVRNNINDTGMTLICRAPERGPVEALFLRILTAAEKTKEWDTHLCQRYLPREGNLVYAWNIMFGSPTPEGWEKILEVITGAPRRQASGPNAPAALNKPGFVDEGGEKVLRMPMAGLPRDAERGKPAPGSQKGAYKPKDFKAPDQR